MTAPLVPPALAWFVGLVLAQWVQVGWLFWGAVAVVALGLGLRARRHATPTSVAPLGATWHLWLWLGVLALGGCWQARATPDTSPRALASYNDLPDPAMIRGVVAHYPDLQGNTLSPLVTG